MMKSEILTKHRVLSLESETFALNNIVESTRSLLVSFIGDIRSFITTTFGNGQEQATTFGFVKDNTLERDLKKSNYTSVMMLESYVPPGMVVEWLKYIEALEICQDVTDNLLPDVLKPAIQYFGLVLGSPERLKERSPATDSKQIKSHEKQIESSKKTLQTCYSDRTTATKRPFGDVFKRNADWTEANLRLQKVVERLSKTPPKEVLEYVDQLSDILDRLALRLQQSPDLYEVSSITSKTIADICLGIAKEVEFYAAHCFIMKTATSAMSDTNEKLKDILKNG